MLTPGGARARLDRRGPITAPSEGLEAIYHALVLGLSDYVRKNRFPGVVLGLSGGIDSALTAAVAVDALGPERVRAVMMPSPYTAARAWRTRKGARRCSASASHHRHRAGDGGLHADAGADLRGREPDITEENIQTRARGITLMALSNKFGRWWCRPATSPRCPWATPRSTATCAAATRSSRTSTR